MPGDAGEDGPVLICYDGSDGARNAVAQAGAVLRGGAATVLTVWESLGSAVLAHPPPGPSRIAREAREISEDVIDQLDSGVAERAAVISAEGAEVARAAGFQASPLARRALGRFAERSEETVWQAVVGCADEQAAALVVLGSRGRSGVSSALLGSVSYGVLHHSRRPVLIVPSPGQAVRGMVLEAPGGGLRPAELLDPRPGRGQVLVKVRACGVCRTDLHVVDGELELPRLPLVPGHQIVGTVAGTGERVGVPWLGWTCGKCVYCRSGRENLCDFARFTGRDIDGGFAEYAVADRRFCFPIPDGYPDAQAAPLLCAGLIGHRALRMTGDAQRLGLYGFGAAAHIVCQVAVHEGRRVFAFTRGDDTAAQGFARELGAEWAGDASGAAPEELDAAIVFAPVGALVPAALRTLAKGGTAVCAGIHMSDIPSFPYEILWGERAIRSVANLTRRDGEEFLKLAPQVPVRTRVVPFALDAANQALDQLRAGRLTGAAVLVVDEA